MSTSVKTKLRLSVDFGRIYLVSKEILGPYEYFPDKEWVPEFDLEPGLYGFTMSAAVTPKGSLEISGKVTVLSSVVIGDVGIVLGNPDSFDVDAVSILAPEFNSGRYLDIGKVGEYDVEIELNQLLCQDKMAKPERPTGNVKRARKSV